MNKIILKSCPLCNSTHVKHSMTCTDFYVSEETFDLFSCSQCGFVFTQGFPVGENMDKYYEAPEYISHSDTHKGIVNTVYHQVRKYMLTRKARLINKEVNNSPGHLLDIGTGTGYFPHTMQKYGWNVQAIEKNQQARQFAKEKFDLNVKDTDSLNRFSPETFKVITLWHVMEHLEHPGKMWETFYELLEPEGILVIAVPNRISYDAQKYKEYWAAYDVPRHLWHFTPSTIRKMGTKYNFTLSSSYAMPFDAFYVSMLSEKYRGNAFAFIKGMLTGITAWLRCLSKKEKSSSMIYVFRKKKDEEQETT